MSKVKLVPVILVTALFTLSIISCKDAKKEENIDENKVSSEMHADDEGNHDHSTMEESKMNHDGNNSESDGMSSDMGHKTSKTTMIVDSYLQLKNALVDSNKKKAADAGKMMLDAFSSFDMASLTEAQHKEYMEILESAKEHAEHIVKSPLDHQREHFEVLSTDINDLITLIGTEKTLYQTFCPMYNKGKGGMWLSEFKEIKNPFYGSKMLSCGEVKKQIN